MKLTGNTILITGGGSGIGRGLAEQFAKRGNRVVVAGRTQASLDEVTHANPKIGSVTLDVTDPNDVTAVASRIVRDYPELNVLVNNAGLSRSEDLSADSIDLADATAMIATNLLGPIRLTAALLPHLRAQSHATILNNSSGLAFVPLAPYPTYCATKAAIHSYTESLRYQLRDTNVDVLELVPPYVQTELGGARQRNDPNAMPLDAFITEVMQLLESGVRDEILVKNVEAMRFAERGGQERYASVFDGMNGRFAAAAH